MSSPSDWMKESKFQFVREVFREELAYVRARWKTVYSRRKRPTSLEARTADLDKAQGNAGPAAAVTVDNGLVGLAFSGGGIRSATFHLGVVQALHKRRVLDHVDYLSTVSGGGYLGASLSTIMRDGAEFPFEHPDGPTESPYVTWLRNHSNYLAQRGFLDYARIVALLLRGVLVNLLVLVPSLLLLSVGFFFWQRNSVTFFDGTNWEGAFLATGLAVAAAVFYMFAFPVVVRVFKVLSYERRKGDPAKLAASESSVKTRDYFERTYGGTLVAVLAVAAIEVLPILLYLFHQMSEWHFRGVFAGIAGASSMVALTVVGKLLARFKGVGRKVVIWVVGLLGLLLPLLLILYVTEGLVWTWKDSMPFVAWVVPAVFIGLLVGGGLATLAAKSKWLWLVAVSALVGILVGIAFVLIAAVLFGSSVAPWHYVAGLAVLIWFFCWLAIDVNLTSISGFYRDRLAAAYLVGIDVDRRRDAALKLSEVPLADVAVEEDLNLQDICQGELPGESPSIAPYHLVNVTHNLQATKDPSVRDRKSDFLMFSKKFYGGTRTGYCSTVSLEAVFPQMDLATAMAISAAAAAPNMGGGTVGSVVAIMTLFNIRLGYWVPNPAKLGPWAKQKGEPLESSIGARFLWRIRPSAFIKEMFSRLDEASNWVNLSDGGHIENLGIYELLRRRCKYIIGGDSGADPEITFSSLAKLKRFARIDMGIEIEIDLDDLRLRDGLNSREHCVLGHIRYPVDDHGGQETGYLIYIKPTLTGDEDEVIRQYKSKNPRFPHESTADQFFDEGQLEAYRALGFHIADGLFAGAGGVNDFADFTAWIESRSAGPGTAPPSDPAGATA